MNNSAKIEAYSRGFVVGQAAAYCEQVCAGAKLAAQLGCSRVHLDDVLEQVRIADCKARVEVRQDDRVAVWIFKHEFVASLLDGLNESATPPSAAGVWAMGKLFGYSDTEIGSYLINHKLIRSASD